MGEKDEGYGVKGREIWGSINLLNYLCLLKGRRLWGDLLTLLIDMGFLKRTKNMG
jgi:hypothetical protein